MTREVRQYAWLRSSVLTIGAVFFFGAILTLVRLWPLLREALHPTTIACGCAVMAIKSPWWVVGIGLIAAGIILYTGVYFITMVTIHLLASRHQINNLRRRGIRTMVHQRLGLRFLLVDVAEPIAVTIGMRHPQIYLSTGLLRRLSGGEVEAVLAHEQAHQRALDPLMTALLDSLAKSFRWIPRATAWVATAYSLRELAADAYATDNYRATQALSSAFLKLNDTRPLASGNAFSPNHDRIEKLLDQNWTPRQDWWNWAAVGVVGVVLVAMFSLGRYAKAITPSRPPDAAAAACRQTIVMCQVERWPFPQPQTVCGTGRCLTVEHPWTPAYVISFRR